MARHGQGSLLAGLLDEHRINASIMNILGNSLFSSVLMPFPDSVGTEDRGQPKIIGRKGIGKINMSCIAVCHAQFSGHVGIHILGLLQRFPCSFSCRRCKKPGSR